jgi:ribonuclease-3
LTDQHPAEAALGVEFHDPDMLALALVHSSYLNENPGSFAESNERLEFLGDAVIGNASAHELYRRNPDWPEGRLTEARSDLVRRETLARVAARVGLGDHLQMGRGEASGGGRQRQSVLASALEAVVGAIFLDQGYDAAEEFLLRVLAPEMARLGRPTSARNPKSAFQEAVQAMGTEPPKYRIVDVTGEEHARVFTAEVSVDGRVLGSGKGPRKSTAEQRAAAAALNSLQPTDPDSGADAQ